MACCQRNPDQDDGYALPAALVLSLTLAVIGAALLARGMTTLRLARDDIDRLRIEKALDGAQLLAASTIVSSQNEGPYQWSIATEAGPMRIAADQELGKLDFLAAAELPAEFFRSLGVLDPEALKARLTNAAAQADRPVTADLDSAPLWKFCAPVLISPLGQAQTLQYTTPREPGPGHLPASWRIGEIWRVSIATSDGWGDSRLVRFTGDAERPVATVSRRFFRTTITGEKAECERRLSDWTSG